MGRPRVTLLLDGTEWAADAACKDIHVDFFYPEDPMDNTAPRSVCRKCPVRVECLEYALVNNEPYGVWGGLTTKERKRLIKHERGQRFA